jgi:alcohol dehydrogenase (cytochrome c)
MMKRTLRKTVVATSLALIAIIVVSGIAGSAYYHLNVNSTKPISEIWSAISWRAQIYARKAEGRIPELSWTELVKITMHPGGFSLGNLIVEGHSVNGAVSNPYTSPKDREAGGHIFNERCARCHGLDGKGSLGPSLAGFGYKHGDSDLAIFRVLADGIPGTAMIAPDISFTERWQVIAYLRTLQLRLKNDEIRQLNVHVSSEQIRRASEGPGEWLTYSGSLSGWRYSSLSQITPANVSQLRVRWVYQSSTNQPKFEVTPLVVGGTIFVTEPPATVLALDAKTGQVVWKYQRPIQVDVPVCCGIHNRGLAILGNSLFFASLDGYLISINANTGNVNWQTRVVSPSDGFSLSGAPLVVNNSVVVGVAGAEYGIRGFLAAYDVATGQQKWKFDTVPGPGEAGHETWQSGDAWKTGGGSSWVTGSYDPSLDLLYWGIGNPAPPMDGDVRPGDNLFTDSVIALHASSGKLAWYFQFTPHDEHDWDSAQTPILADLLIDGSQRKVICWPNRNGFYYVLDRVTGQFLTGTPFVELNWAKGLTSQGKPILENTNRGPGVLTKPGYQGATIWQPAAFNPALGLVFIDAIEGEGIFTKSASNPPARGEHGYYMGSAGSIVGPVTPVVRALDAATGAKRWEYYQQPSQEQFIIGGMLATSGGLVFGASEGSLFALDAATGKKLWSVSLGGITVAPPISFTLEGQQVIAVFAGRAMFVFGL